MLGTLSALSKYSSFLEKLPSGRTARRRCIYVVVVMRNFWTNNCPSFLVVGWEKEAKTTLCPEAHLPQQGGAACNWRIPVQQG